ncbi:MAG TPA: hypothetical protein VEY89_02055 [Candidatus Dormibacteraeota bacterium]|nr:hypothetical protein [Candidatus Dormibacteraeota bacterium]
MTAGALVCVAPALGDSPAGAAFAPVVHSALITVDGVVASDTLVLRVLRNADRQPLAGAELTVSVDGRSVPVTPRAAGTWEVPIRDLPTKPPGRFSITVAHDGLREVLDGRLPGSGTAAPPSHSGNAVGALIHKQTAWWILNVVIVLIGVIAVSRRMS